MTTDINNTSLPDTGVDGLEMAARYHDAKAAKWRKAAKKHTRGRFSDYEQHDLDRAKRHETDAAAIRALKVCQHGIRHPWACNDCDAAALSARASVAVAVGTGIKQLEWDETDERWWGANPIYGLCYEIRITDRGTTRVRWPENGGWEEFPGDLKAAKTAAQSDFEARILASLTAPVEETVEPVAWRVVTNNTALSFYNSREDAEHGANNRLTYVKGCTSAVVEPLYGEAKPATSSADETRPAAEARIMQDYQWGNLTKLGVANHLRRAGFNLVYATEKANALASTASPSIAGEEARACLSCRGKGTEADYVGDDMRCVETDCHVCGGSGKQP